LTQTNSALFEINFKFTPEQYLTSWNTWNRYFESSG